MKSYDIIRAISSEFVIRKVKPLAFISAFFMAVFVLIAAWLTTVSVWWWLLFIPVAGILLVWTTVCVVVTVVVRKLRPQLNHQQVTGVRRFVDKLERAAESLQTPTLVIVYRVTRDIIWPPKVSFVQTVAKDGTTLHRDLAELWRSF